MYTNESAREVPKSDQLLQSTFVHKSVVSPCELVKHTGTVFLVLLLLAQVTTKRNWVQT